jgi:RHS repeat-associated protein
MGALRLTYNQREEALEKSSLFVVGALEVNGVSEKNRVRTYRYGFNGMEKDDEAKGNGNHYTTYWRQYDPRLGRWMSREPKPVAWESEYASFRNNPIYYADPNGDWVKGAGLANNVFKGDKRNKAEMAAKEHKDQGGKAFKTETGWGASWTEGSTEEIKDDKGNTVEVNLKAYVQVEFKYGGGSVEDAMQDYMRSGWLLETDRNYTVDGRRKGGFRNGMVLLAGTAAFIATAGQGTAAWGLTTTSLSTNILFAGSMASTADNVSTILYGNGETFLSQNTSISQGALDWMKFGISASNLFNSANSMKLTYFSPLMNSSKVSKQFITDFSFQIHGLTMFIQDGASQLKK